MNGAPDNDVVNPRQYRTVGAYALAGSRKLFRCSNSALCPRQVGGRGSFWRWNGAGNQLPSTDQCAFASLIVFQYAFYMQGGFVRGWVGLRWVRARSWLGWIGLSWVALGQCQQIKCNAPLDSQGSTHCVSSLRPASASACACSESHGIAAIVLLSSKLSLVQCRIASIKLTMYCCAPRSTRSPGRRTTSRGRSGVTRLPRGTLGVPGERRGTAV